MKKKVKIGRCAGIALLGILAGVGICHLLNTTDEAIIGVIPQYNSFEFQRIQSGLLKEAGDLGYELEVVIPEEMTVQAQRKAMEELVEKGADCILIQAVAEGGFQDVLDECTEKGIPVLTYNSRINSPDIYAEILPYSIESVAEEILASISAGTDGSGQYGVLSSTSQDYLKEARTREMLSILERGEYPEIHFTGTGFVKEDETLVAEKAAQLELKYPDLEYIVCYTTLDAKAISEYIRKTDANWKLVGEASLEELGDSVLDGTVVLTYDYRRYGKFMAKLAVTSTQAKQAPVAGDIFEWEDNREYSFQSKWEVDKNVTVPTAEAADICSITMQDAPETVIRENGSWK